LRRVAAKWVRGPNDERAIKDGCVFDVAAGRYVCDFIERFCRLSEGRWVGEPIRLIPWQRDWIMRLYGWRRRSGKRRYQSTYGEVAKKNGKSPIVSGLADYHLVGDGEGGPKIYLNACDREQARIVFETAANMVRQSPELAARLEIVESRHRIVCRENMGVIIANSSLVDAKDGRNSSLVVFDELHRQPDRRLWNVFQGAGASREQPINLSITTAGEDEEGVWHEQREYSEKVESGEIEDTTHLGVVYRALITDDLDDPAVWAKANPSLGHTITAEQFQRDLAKAKLFPLDWSDFLRKRFNIVASGATKYFDPARWDALANPGLRIEDLAGLDAWFGLDLANVNDLAALVVLARHGERFRAVTRFWCPEGSLARLERETRRPYQAWAARGHLVATPGESIDYAFIRNEVCRLARGANVVKIGVDPYNATQLATQLDEEDGLPVATVTQGYLTLSPATKELLRMIDAGRIEHDGNPVMRWCIANAVATRDDAENVKLSKKKSRQKIDGASAAVDAVAAMLGTPAPPKASVYNTRGPRCV
jgi:phage terminase large subunit-like protein